MPAAGPEVCSPLPASPYSFVLGSKLFPAQLTVAPLLGRLPGPGFAPPSLLALILPSKGANFSLPSSLWRPFWPDFCSSRSRGSHLKTDFIGFAGTRARTEPPDGPTLNERTGTRGAHSHLPGFGPFLTFLYLTLPYFTLLYLTTTLPICFFRCR